MTDRERIEMYYLYGAMDWRSESDKPAQSPVKKNFPARGLRILKLATLMWCTVLKHLSRENKRPL